MSLRGNPIVKAVYISRRQELWLEFEKPVRPSYTCAVFVNVPSGAIAQFKAAATPEIGFESYIRKNYKYYLSFFDNCEIFRTKNWTKTADQLTTYAEYQAKLKRELEEKDIAAMNAL